MPIHKINGKHLVAFIVVFIPFAYFLYKLPPEDAMRPILRHINSFNQRVFSNKNKNSFSSSNSDDIHVLPDLPSFTKLEWEVVDKEACALMRKESAKQPNDKKCDGDLIQRNFMNPSIDVSSFEVFQYSQHSSESVNASGQNEYDKTVFLDHQKFLRKRVSHETFIGAMKDAWRDMSVRNIRIPNISHAVHLFIKLEDSKNHGQPTNVSECSFEYYHYVGYVSMLWIQRPRLFLFWLDLFPTESSRTCQIWWDFIANVTSIDTSHEENTKVFFIQRTAPTSVFNNEIINTCHQTDVIRMQALLLYGGIYTDSDTFVVRPFTEIMRQYNMAIGNHTTGLMNNAVILAERNNRFLRLWYATYQSFNGHDWGFHSMYLPTDLTKLLWHLCHVSARGFYLFNFTILKHMRNQKRPWRSQEWIPQANGINSLDVYTFHLYPSNKNLVTSYEKTIAYDCLLGDLCRYILLNNIVIPNNVQPLNCTID